MRFITKRILTYGSLAKVEMSATIESPDASVTSFLNLSHLSGFSDNLFRA